MTPPRVSDYSLKDEGKADYKIGGYHAVRIGDSFKDGCYVVQRKLGWGHFSTVWHAWDTKTKRHVALKVQKSALHCTEAAMDELKILKRIAAGDPDNKKCVVKLLDFFEHLGPNGQHVCMVFELLGDSLLTLIKNSDCSRVPLDVVKKCCFHILVGLDYLHRELSIIHTDLKPENILLSMIDPSRDPRKSDVPLILPTCSDEIVPQSSASKDVEILNKIREKLEKAAQSSVGKETSKENEADSGPFCPHSQCKLVDFGSACCTYRQFTSYIQKRQYRCPEALLGSKYSTPADLWSFACICFELATGNFLFDPRGDDRVERNENHLASMMELLGTMPRKIALGGHYSREFFTRHGDLRHIQDLRFLPINKVLMKKYSFSERDAKDMTDFLLPLLDFVPEKRPTAVECLIHPWISAGPRLLEPSMAAIQPQAAGGGLSSELKKENDERQPMENDVVT